MISEQTLHQITSIVDRLRPLVFPHLAGLPAEVQGAVLADLTAIWLAGHLVAGDEAATRALREELLQHQISAIRDLTEINARRPGKAAGGSPFPWA